MLVTTNSYPTLQPISNQLPIPTKPPIYKEKFLRGIHKLKCLNKKSKKLLLELAKVQNICLRIRIISINSEEILR